MQKKIMKCTFRVPVVVEITFLAFFYCFNAFCCDLQKYTKSTLTLRPDSHLLLWTIGCTLVSKAQKVMFSRAQKHGFRSWKVPFRKTKSPLLGDMKKPRADGSTRQRNLRTSFVTLSPIFTLACTNGSGQEGCNSDICTCCIHASGCRSSKARTVQRATACRICDSASWWEVTPSEFLFAW